MMLSTFYLTYRAACREHTGMPRHPGRIIPRTAHSPLASVGKQCMCVGYSKITDGETNENPASRRKAAESWNK